MGKSRVVNTSFWKDDKVIDEYSIEDKYFMLYLFTSPNSELLGMYKLPMKIMSFETGYTIEMIKVMLDRFMNKYDIIVYDFDTQEILIKNYLKYSIVKGGKPVFDSFVRSWSDIKSMYLKIEFIKYFENIDVKNRTVTDFIHYTSSKLNEKSDNYDIAYANAYALAYANAYARHVNVSCDDSLNVVDKYFDNKEVDVLFNDFLENRKNVHGKKINTAKSISLLVNKLNKHNDLDKIKMLNNAIEAGWKSIFPILKGNNVENSLENQIEKIREAVGE